MTELDESTYDGDAADDAANPTPLPPLHEGDVPADQGDNKGAAK